MPQWTCPNCDRKYEQYYREQKPTGMFWREVGGDDEPPQKAKTKKR